MYAQVLGCTTATCLAAVVLPNTGANRVMAGVATVTLVAGVIVTLTTLARMIAKKANKA